MYMIITLGLVGKFDFAVVRSSRTRVQLVSSGLGGPLPLLISLLLPLLILLLIDGDLVWRQDSDWEGVGVAQESNIHPPENQKV